MINEQLKTDISKFILEHGSDGLNAIVEYTAQECQITQPVAMVKWIAIDKVCPNDYNPNSVAKKEMGLLYKSIKADGYTQPIVTIFDEEKDKYVIVDGFHRYFTCLTNPDILERNKGLLPIVVIDKSINDRMSATVRHNRARGAHSVQGMSSMVNTMLRNGWDADRLMNELGMTKEEVIKLLHITGFSFLFKDKEYNNEWQTQSMIKNKIEYAKNNNLEIRDLV